MSGRIWRWIGGGLLLGLLPLVAAYLFRYYRLERAPALKDLLGSGQALLVAVTWHAAALREARDAPAAYRAHRDFVSIVATLLLLVGAMAYGFISADQLSGAIQSEKQRDMVTYLSVVLLTLAAWTSGYAVAIGKETE